MNDPEPGAGRIALGCGNFGGRCAAGGGRYAFFRVPTVMCGQLSIGGSG
jgi:hypothetical protein